MLYDAPAPMSPNVQLRSCDPWAPLIEQAEPVWDWMVHVTPVSDGSVSLRVTPVAVPGPLLDTVIVNPMFFPEFTGVASAVLVMAMFCGFTTMMAKSKPSLQVAVAILAVLGSDPEVHAVVGLVMWML